MSTLCNFKSEHSINKIDQAKKSSFVWLNYLIFNFSTRKDTLDPDSKIIFALNIACSMTWSLTRKKKQEVEALLLVTHQTSQDSSCKG